VSGGSQEEHQQSEFDPEEHSLEQQQYQQFEHLRVQQQPAINESGCEHLIF